VAAPVELRVVAGSGGSNAGGSRVVVAKIEVAALCKRLESCDPRYVGLLRGVGAVVVPGTASAEFGALVRRRPLFPPLATTLPANLELITLRFARSR
jgi:hypothetical protein